MNCSVVGCTSRIFVKKRQLCQRHYMWMRATGNIKQVREAADTRTGLADTWHRAEYVDRETNTGDCSICGPGVPMMVKVDGRPVCAIGSRESHRRMRYRLEPEKLTAMLERAGGGCEICREPLNLVTLRVDHDHACCPGTTTCGKCVRGVLCHRCNVALGFMRDNPANLQAAIEYLSRNSSFVRD